MRKLFFCIALVAIAGSNGWAQGPEFTVSGTVTDASGSVIANADVRLISAQQVVTAASRSDETGRYTLGPITAGTYVLEARRGDFSPTRQAIQIAGGSVTSADIVLELNRITADVTVTAAAGQAEETHKTPQQVNVISEDAILERATQTMAQVAEEETGVSMQKTSPTIGAVLVRGLTEVGVYVDGVRYTNSTQRGGINTFFNLNEPSGIQTVEIQRSPNTAQFGSDGLGGNVQLLSRQPSYGFDTDRFHGEYNTFYGSADHSFGGNTLMTYGTRRVGLLGNLFSRRVNTLRPGRGIDSHSAINRFFGLPSDIVGIERLTDTGFTQYGANFQLNFSPTERQNLSFRYQRSQQDGGKRYDQLLGGDGNLIADLKNLMLDFGYLRYTRVGAGPFDNMSAKISFNSQREQRVNQGGQGNPLGAITNDRERTTSWGLGLFADKIVGRHTVLIGGDHYHDRVSAPSFSIDPSTSVARLVRPRVPDGATYDLTGIYAQNVFDAINGRLRISGAVRYNVASYRSSAANSPLVNGEPLFPDDSATFKDLSGRIGATVTIMEGLNAAFNYSRGFRAPNVTSLGGLGLVGVGYQVSTSDLAGLGASIGSTADASAVSTGRSVEPLRSEISDNIDLSLRYRNSFFDASVTAFVMDYSDTIVRQTLILPQGAVGLMLGSQPIISQNANGAVFVPASTSPVLVQANFSDARMKGVEINFDYAFTNAWRLAGNYSYLHAADKATGEPPNLGGGGLPPPFGMVRLRYQPGTRYWIEGYVNLAGRQDRLSSLDLSDRRTGASRTRAQIQNFFRRGACLRGITTPGTNGLCGSAGGILIATGETLAQVQDRVLPIGTSINGAFILDNDTAAPLFNGIPGYGLVNIRGGYRVNENLEITADVQNIADKSHRAPGWGIDGPGRGLTVRMRYRF